MKKSIVDIKKQILSLQKRIERIQNKCSHKNVKWIEGANTGHIYEGDDSYWMDYNCPDCGKRWREDQ